MIPPPTSPPPTSTMRPPVLLDGADADKAFFAVARRRARGAYERRRALDAAARSLPGLLLVVVAGALGAPPAALALGATGLMAAFLFARHGLALGDGVPLGLLLGAVPVVASAAGPTFDAWVSPASCGEACAVIALLGGGAVGALLGERLRRGGQARSLVASLVVGGLLAPMGCMPLAQGGLLGLGVGLALGAASGLSLAGAR